MHQLDRASVPAPRALSQYSAPQAWDDVTNSDKHEIRDALGTLQGGRCAYCERPLEGESKSPHIEHFEQRSRNPELTFDWNNLFWSCSQPEHCGKHKDSAGIVNSYTHGDLIKPDVDNPRQYLEFTDNGGVRARRGLSSADERRASETIRIFNLDAPTLRTARVAYFPEPRRLALEALDLPESDARQLLAGYADDYRGSAYEAAIFDILGVR